MTYVLYAVDNISDCEIGIVEVTHSHFHHWDDAIAFCAAIVLGCYHC